MKQVKFQLKLFVEKERNRVVFAEAGSDFIDTLFSFLTLPMGTIVRILNNNLESESRVIGSFSNYTLVSKIWTPGFYGLMNASRCSSVQGTQQKQTVYN